jgi:GT2 family glycosyltransferase
LTSANAASTGDPVWIAGMFMVVSSSAFHLVGGFDEGLRLYCEDFDLCARLRLAAYRLKVVDTVSATHLAQRASRRSPRHLRWHLQSLLRVWTTPVFWRYRRLLKAGG